MIPRVQENFRIGRTNYQERAMSYLRTPEHRARQAALIRTWCPWKKSTGPKTPAGKAVSANNAFKGGHGAELRALTKTVNAMLREQRRAQ
jgi:hypothetical protein